MVVFLILGTIQLFLLGQARLMTELAAFRATRQGSLSQGRCERMLHAAILTVLPTFDNTRTQNRLVNAFDARSNNRYQPGLDSGHDGDIIWIFRPTPALADLPNLPEDSAFDDPDEFDRGNVSRLEVQMIFWYPMRIPFANWVIARIAQAATGVQNFSGYNPLDPTRRANWQTTGGSKLGTNTRSGMAKSVTDEWKDRTDSAVGTYVFPIQATYGMRMMTPPRRSFFDPQNCR